MGNWKYKNFDNDAAADFLSEFQEMPSEVALLEALTVVIEMGEEGDYLEVDEASVALAAAELVAAALGRPAPGFPADLQAAVQELDLGEDPELQEMAQEAVAAVLQASELKELWEERADFGKWQAVQQDLLARLQASE